MNVSLDAAYKEACTALGEQVVIQRLLTQEVATLTARVAELEAEAAGQVPATDH